MSNKLQAWLDPGTQTTLPGIHPSPFLSFAFLCVGFTLGQVLVAKMAASSSKYNSYPTFLSHHVGTNFLWLMKQIEKTSFPFLLATALRLILRGWTCLPWCVCYVPVTGEGNGMFQWAQELGSDPHNMIFSTKVAQPCNVLHATGKFYVDGILTTIFKFFWKKKKVVSSKGHWVVTRRRRNECG